MAEDTTITLAEGGTHETIIFVKDIEIKDLWHCAMAIKTGESQYWDQKTRDVVFDQIIEVWGLAHDLKKHIMKEEE